MRHMNRNRCIFILMIISIKTSTCFDIEIIRGGRDKILRNSERCEQFNANLPNTTCTCLPASPTFMSTETDETFKCQQNEHIKEGKLETHRCFLRFLNCKNVTKSCKESHIS